MQRILDAIASVIDNVRNVDDQFQILRIEMESLHQVLISISNNFNDPALRQAAIESQAGREAEPWRNVIRSMADCKGTLENTERKLEKVGGSWRRLFGQPTTIVRLSMISTEIGLLQQRLAAYRRNMNLSLQMISVPVGPYLLRIG